MSTPRLDPREEHFSIPGPLAGLPLFLRRLRSESAPNGPPVVYVHGATFPSALSIAHRFRDGSWRDALCHAGFDVWAFDFYGFGGSARFPEMNESADVSGPLLLAVDAVEQVAAAVRFVAAQTGAAKIHIISHSWGSMPACLLAQRHPELVGRIVLFAPITWRQPPRYLPRPDGSAWRIVTVEDQFSRFVEDVPAGVTPVLSRNEFDVWAQAYLDSDPDSRSREPNGVKVPTGPFVEILRAWHGELPYDAARVTSPVCIIRGEWDGLVTDADARWLFDAFLASPDRRDIKIGRATHLMHLEEQRGALWRESIAFLTA